ncbi:MAG: DUF4367 domain-containing protein [Candidatus Acidiferrales bacterium]
MAIVVVVVVVAWVSFPPTRRLTQRFFGSLRMQKVQAVNVNLSNFVGPNANSTLQQMVSTMISDKVTVTVNEKAQTAPNAAAASKLAGFQVQLPAKRTDTPELDVAGTHAFDLTVDRARLQAILKEAGRSDLSLPPSIDGAVVDVTIPRRVRARYGTCPGRPSATANVATPTPSSMQYNNCVILTEGPSPEVKVPSGLDIQQLAEIGLELAGMTPAQAQQFLHTVNWKSTLGISIPRFMRSYEAVKVNGVEGTLLDMAGRRGPTYTLIWAKNGTVYSLTGFGNSGEAVSLANSVE